MKAADAITIAAALAVVGVAIYMVRRPAPAAAGATAGARPPRTTAGWVPGSPYWAPGQPVFYDDDGNAMPF